MNIRVDLNTPIKDGTEVVFRSPVDCSQVTGLKVYYPGADGNTTSQEFVLADAHGNNVGDIDHLFAENVAVKVILDVTTGMAFVQNADTNAYLEGRFNGIIDTLCPSFTESGSVAACEPLEGYPLEVVSTIDTGADSITLTRCGKNLFDFNSGTQQLSWVDAEGTTFRYKGYAIKLPPGTYTIHCEQVSGITEKDYYIGTITVDANGVSRPRDTVGSGAIYWGNEATRITRTITIADGDILYAYDGQTNHTEAQADDRFSRENIQLEAGSAATAYEPYRGQTFTADFTNAPEMEGSGFYNWNTGVMNNGASDYLHDPTTGIFTMISDETMEKTIIRNIPAISGLNSLYSDCGDTTVNGRADPKALLETLTNAIISLGGNV